MMPELKEYRFGEIALWWYVEPGRQGWKKSMHTGRVELSKLSSSGNREYLMVSTSSYTVNVPASDEDRR